MALLAFANLNLRHSPQSSDSGAGSSLEEEESAIQISKSLDECYFAGREGMCPKDNLFDEFQLEQQSRKKNKHPMSSNKPHQRKCSDIEQHLQSMFSLLRPQDTLKMAVKLESGHVGRTRYLVVVSSTGRSQTNECCLLGIDCNERTTIGLVLKVLADTSITLDGDGGFSVSVCGRQHIFKPVSVQAMWSALQTLHRVSLKAREKNYFEGGVSHEWADYYEERIHSDRSCLNEWHAMNDIQSRRPPSPDSLRSRPRERLQTEVVIRSTLKEIMMSVDLDQVTSKYIRIRLEEQLDVDLREYKSFIDQEMLVILGQMDAATQVFPHVYLGSEWNASNLEELNKNGVCHILNVSREIDNFFPGIFDYLNVRVYDDDNTDLLKHWDNTYKYINKAKKEGSKVLVHCKMGVSRSASVVIAYAMKAYNWNLTKAMDFVKNKRNCIKPNSNFITQLETYQGILDAMKNKEKLQRSKSETNLKVSIKEDRKSKVCHEQVNINYEDSEVKYEMDRVSSDNMQLPRLLVRPKSWSPDNLMASNIFPNTNDIKSSSTTSLNNRNILMDDNVMSNEDVIINVIPPAPPLPPPSYHSVRMPCGNGLAYSVSQNKIVQLYSNKNYEDKNMEKREMVKKKPKVTDGRGFVLNLTSHFESNTISPGQENNLVKPDDVKTAPIAIINNSKRTDKLRKLSNSGVTGVSRQSSWSSYDSAVALNWTQDNYSASRESVWDPSLYTSRHSSLGSDSIIHLEDDYDENNKSEMKNKTRHYASSPSLSYPYQPPGSTWTSPRIINTTQCSSVKNQAMFLQELTTGKDKQSILKKSKKDNTRRGMVSNLKKEFEAKCKFPGKSKEKQKDNSSRSLPSSPISEHHKSSCSAPSMEDMQEDVDLSVRKLVGKYEIPGRVKSQPPIPPRKSSLDINKRNVHKNRIIEKGILNKLSICKQQAQSNTM